MVLNAGPLDWKSSALTTRPLLHCLLVSHQGCALNLLGGIGGGGCSDLQTPCRFLHVFSRRKGLPPLQTQFGTQRQWYDKVLGKTPGPNICWFSYIKRVFLWFYKNLSMALYGVCLYCNQVLLVIYECYL